VVVLTYFFSSIEVYGGRMVKQKLLIFLPFPTGDGAKLVRDAFALAKEKAPAIIFIDELDAIGTKRFDSEKAGDREVQRTMLELLNQLDGFSSTADIKVSSLVFR
jgi:ATP-dependent 26S proteasome regulatory subunit